MSCAVDDGAHRKLMFKYNGTRTLTDKGMWPASNVHIYKYNTICSYVFIFIGSFENVPAYSPPCSEITATPTVSSRPTNSYATASTFVVPTSPGKSGHTDHSESLAFIIGIPIMFILLVLVVVFLIIIIRLANECTQPYSTKCSIGYLSIFKATFLLKE